jgi:hypothetical protein
MDVTRGLTHADTNPRLPATSSVLFDSKASRAFFAPFEPNRHSSDYTLYLEQRTTTHLAHWLTQPWTLVMIGSAAVLTAAARFFCHPSPGRFRPTGDDHVEGFVFRAYQ